ncbi:MAG: hypothetical protein Ta2B_21440 [Termitinemataceae bacterium]|nr:MAG: hypothetical protein Ta2B_21440 [Termitinemataceae bacterium]
MVSNRYILNYKLSDIANEYAKLYNTDLRTAFDAFYRSELYHKVRDGISDMHCRSDAYLAEELSRELEAKASGVVI